MIFEVTPEQIQALSDSDLRTLVGYLAEREAVSQGQSTVGITYSGHQNAKDGGIDVRADLLSVKTPGYLQRPNTGFQVKAEDMPRSAILKEMAPDEKLRASIKALADCSGSYVIVSSKGSVAHDALNDRRAAMAEAVADYPNGAKLHLDFYDRRRLATWVNQHPGLIPWVRGRSGQALSGWRPFADWSSSPRSIEDAYVLDDGTRLIGPSANDQAGLTGAEGINRLRNVLREPKGVVRLIGLSGVGKTRLAQALFDQRVGDGALDRHVAIYTDVADAPDPVPLELLNNLQHQNAHCVLIIDNCGLALHSKLAASVKSSDSPISLITIEYDVSDDEPENTEVFRLEPTTQGVITKILETRYPALTSPEIRTISEFSEGNARIALVLADTAKEGGSLANLKSSELFDRLFKQKNDADPSLLQTAKALSLVYSFDAETLEGESVELPILANLVEHSVTLLHGHIAEMERRRLVQRRSKWRALLPHALAHRLAKQALQDIHPDLLRTKFIQIAPERLLKSFSRRLGCLHDSAEAQQIVASWLNAGGFLSNIETLNEFGLTILENVAPVNPEMTLAAIRRAYQRSPALFDTTRRHRQVLIKLLRAIAYDAQLFDDAVVMVAHAAKDTPSSNNTDDAINVYKSLFYMHLSGTHASAEQRARMIAQIAREMPDYSHLTLAALDALLESHWFSSHYNFEFGTRKRDFGLNPSTRGEVQAWCAVAFELCVELDEIPALSAPVRRLIANAFNRLAGHAQIDSLVSLAETFLRKGGWAQGWAAVRRASREAKKRSRDNDAKKLQALARRLQPKTLEQRIASYVTPERWGLLDLAETDDVEDSKQYAVRFAKANAKVEAVCAEIGSELAADISALRMHLPNILAPQADRAYAVISSVARHVGDIRAGWSVISEHAIAEVPSGHVYNTPAFFIDGLKQRDVAAVSQILDEALRDTALHPFFVRMQISAGLDSLGIARLIEATQTYSIPTSSFDALVYGRACDELDSDLFGRLLLSIAEREGGLAIAVDAFQMRLFTYKSDNRVLTEVDLEIGRELLRRMTAIPKNERTTRNIAKTVRTCLYPTEHDDLARQICSLIYKQIDEYRISSFDLDELLAVLAELFPAAVLDVLLEAPGMEDGVRFFRAFQAHHPCPLKKIDDEQLLSWAHAAASTRFELLGASIQPWGAPAAVEGRDVPDDEAKTLVWTSAALRLIREAPDPIRVLELFNERLRPMSWSGSRSDALAVRLPLLEALAADKDLRVSRWALAALPRFKDELEEARVWGANRSRQRDERFDW